MYEILNTAVAGLTSTDPMKFDNSYDTLLFENDSVANAYLTDAILANQHSPNLAKFLMQILTFRATQVKPKNWSRRVQGTLTFAAVMRIFLHALSDVHTTIRTEAIECLGELLEHNMKEDDIFTMLTESKQVIYGLRYPQVVTQTLEALQHVASHDIDANVAMLASNVVDKIEKDFIKVNQIDGLVDSTVYPEFEDLLM
jgi:hypothetical protein